MGFLSKLHQTSTEHNCKEHVEKFSVNYLKSVIWKLTCATIVLNEREEYHMTCCFLDVNIRYIITSL